MKIQYPFDISIEFERISSLLEEEVFLVGGSIRDLLLGRNTSDLDFATKKNPKEVVSLFSSSAYSSKYGTTSFKENGFHITIATFRKEEDYLDYRHPKVITFIDDYQIDANRRDFTINALYGKKEGTILDPTGYGLEDLSHKTLRMIGNPYLRLKEDPLRILRAYRFQEELALHYEPTLQQALKELLPLISKLKVEKVKEEIRKFPLEKQKEYEAFFLSFFQEKK